MIFVQSIIRYILIGLSAAIAQALYDQGFDMGDSEQFGAACAAVISTGLVLFWSDRKNKKIIKTIAEKDARIKKLESDPITWNEPPKKEPKYND